MKLFDFKTLEETEIECEECGWMGKGYETEKGYETLPTDIEVYCPVCKNYLGMIIKDEIPDQPPIETSHL